MCNCVYVLNILFTNYYYYNLYHFIVIKSHIYTYTYIYIYEYNKMGKMVLFYCSGDESV